MHKANGITRSQILHSIKHNGSMTADTLSQELGISPVAVRQHLSALQGEGFISTTIERRGLGRPVHRYAVTDGGDEMFPRSYDRVACELLDELRVEGGEAAVDAVFAARSERLRSLLHDRLVGTSLSARVQEAAKVQSDYGFMSEVLSEGADLLLVEHNCAICKLAKQFPLACKHELMMLQSIVGEEATVQRERYILAGDSTCTYRVSPKAV